MEQSPNKIRRPITFKKIEDILHQVQNRHTEKKFNPGQVQISNTPLLHARLVNFFGDLSTEVFSIKVHQNDKMAAIGCSNGSVKVYDIYEGSVLKIGNTSRLSGYPTTSVCWKPKTVDDFVACNCDGTIKWYNKQQQTAYGHFQKKDISYLCCDYQCNQEWCVFGTGVNTLQIFDNETQKQIQSFESGGPQQLEINHHVNRIFSVKCLKKDPNIFFSGGWDSTVQVWDIRQATGSVRKIYGPSISSDSLDLKGNVLLAGNYQNNNIVQLYDFGSGDLIETLQIGQPHNSNSYCFAANYAQRSQHDIIGVALSGSNKIKLLKDKKLACEIKFQAAPLALDFSRMGGKDYLIAGGTEGTIYCFKLEVPK